MNYYTDASRSHQGRFLIITNEESEILLLETIEEEFSVNELEYMALKRCLELAEKNSNIFSDSKLCVEQINGNFKISKEHLKILADPCKKLKEDKNIVIDWLPRKENKAGVCIEKILKRNEKKTKNK